MWGFRFPVVQCQGLPYSQRGDPPHDHPFFVSFDAPQLCQAKGFVCEFCGNDKDIIFPFQLNKCQRCEGEPSLLVAGLGGIRAPSPRHSISLTWRDWKISKPRRLALVLSQDRKEGEGGEEDLEPDVGQRGKSDEEGGDMAEGKREKEGFHASTPGKPVKKFPWNKGSEEEQEMTGGTESETEEEKVYSKQKARRKESGDGHAKRDKVNLLKALHIDRLKRGISKGDRRESDSESVESQDEVAYERKHLWKVSQLLTFSKGFSKRETEDGVKTGVKEEEERLLKKVTQEEAKGAEDSDEISDKGQTAEIQKPGAENVDKFKFVKLLKPQQLSAAFSRGKSKGEADRSVDSDSKREMVTEKEEPAALTQNSWRGRKTRRARRITRGRKIREGSDTESKTEGGDNAETDDAGNEKGEGRE